MILRKYLYTLIGNVLLILCSAQDTTKTCVENYKLDFFIEEHLRAKSLRKDTAICAAEVKSLYGIIDQKNIQLKSDSGIFAQKDSVIFTYKKAYDDKSTKLHKAQKRVTILGTTTIVLISVLLLTFL